MAVLRAERLFLARRRARRRHTLSRRALRPAVALALVGTLVGGAVWTGWSSPALALRSITVKGTSRLTVAEVLAAARAPVGTSLLRLDPGRIGARVAMLAAVRAVSVDRDWPHRLVITVTERQPVAVVALVGAAPFGMAAQSQATQSGGAELVDAEGVAFAAVESAPAGLLPLVLGAPVPGAGDAQARAALQVWASVPFALRQLVVGIEAPSPVDVVLRLTGRRTVVWGGPGETARKVAVLRALMTRSATTYDVSTPDVPVTRP